MQVFQTADEMYGVFGKLFEGVMSREDVAAGLEASELLMHFRYRAPEGSLTLDCRARPVAWRFGQPCPDADVEFTLSGDTAHRFFLGRVNLPRSFALREIVFRGSAVKALKLMPVLKPVYPMYREMLEAMGRRDLLADEERAAPVKSRESVLQRIFRRAPAAAECHYMDTALSLSDEAEDTRHTPTEASVWPEAGRALDAAMLERMLLIRAFEEHLAAANADGRIPTLAVHLSIGQEAVAAGACAALRREDYINTTHRGHGHVLAKGADPRGVMAEIYGKSGGLCGGKGGSMHVTDASAGIMGANGIVGAGVVLGAGAALASSLLSNNRVSLVFIGDGATNHGMFHEGLNLAAVWNLPAVFVCENNQYGEFMPLEKHTRVTRLADRMAAYGIPAATVDGNDARAVYAATREAVEAARAGNGPRFIECVTYRWHGHMEGDAAPYRPAGELEKWMQRCPIKLFKEKLISENILSIEEVDSLEKKARAAVDDAVAFAQQSPEPKPETLLRHIYSPEPAVVADSQAISSDNSRDMTVAQAINEAIAGEMRRDERVILLGEDVALGGYFAVTNELVDEFGEGRVRDTPISEYAIVGAAVGAAIAGLRPIAEILFSDFLTCAADPIINQAAKLRYMSGGQVRIPLVVRTPGGGNIGMGAQHSQSLEGMFSGIPGLIVAAPSDAATATGLLRAAVRSDNPVLFFEHKLLYLEMGEVPGGDYALPLGKARIARPGADVTIVAWSYTVSSSLLAAKALEKRGISAEVIDLLTLYPMDTKTVLESVRRTGRLLVVEEAPYVMGVGAEIVARAVECGLQWFRKPPKRLAAIESPVPYNKQLEQAMFPTVESITAAVEAWF